MPAPPGVGGRFVNSGVGISKLTMAIYTSCISNLSFINKNRGNIVICVLANNWWSAQAGKAGVPFMGSAKSNRSQWRLLQRSRGEDLRTSQNPNHRGEKRRSLEKLQRRLNKAW